MENSGAASEFPSALLEEIRVVAAVIRRGDRFLLCQRPFHKRHGGLWEFPGGKCEPGETDLEAVRREIREELDLEVVRIGEPLLDVRETGSYFRIIFLPVTVEGSPEALEHAAVEWKTLTEIAEVSLAPTDKKLVGLLRSAAYRS